MLIQIFLSEENYNGSSDWIMMK